MYRCLVSLEMVSVLKKDYVCLRMLESLYIPTKKMLTYSLRVTKAISYDGTYVDEFGY